MYNVKQLGRYSVDNSLLLRIDLFLASDHQQSVRAVSVVRILLAFQQVLLFTYYNNILCVLLLISFFNKNEVNDLILG